MASAESLLEAIFDGELAPPGVAPSPLTYRFHAEQLRPPLPNEVLAQRRGLGWVCKDVACIKASCDIPAVGIKGEEVVVSIDQPAKNGTRRLMLQSLKRPDLGITVLCLEADGLSLAGGDESWTIGEPAIIQARRRKKEAPPASTPPDLEQYMEPRPPTEKGYPNARRPVPPVTAPVAALQATHGRQAHIFPPDSPPRTPSPARTPSPERGPVEGGVGHQRTGGPRRPAPQPPKVDKSDAFLRPDVAAGRELEPPRSARGGALDAEIRAAEAEAVQRLVASADAGETGDVKQLLARVDPDSLALSGRFQGATALMAAAQRGRTEVAVLLVEQRAGLEVRDARGWTAVMYAVHGQRPAALQQLLDAGAAAGGASVADETTGATPLMLAAGGARAEMCAALLRHGNGPSMLAARDAEGHTAMHYAARNGRAGSLVTLLSARASVNVTSEDGCTPFLKAASAGRAECVRYLLSNRADPQAKDLEGRTAAALAKVHSHDRVAQALSDAGMFPSG